MVSVVIDGNRAVATGKMGNALLAVSVKMEGQKKWLKAGGFSFQPTNLNIKLFRETFPEAVFDDKRDVARKFDPSGLPLPPQAFGAVIQGGRLGVGSGEPTVRAVYASRTQPYGVFQTTATEKCLSVDAAALFMEQGTGKSKVTIDVFGTRWCNNQIDAVLIIALNGVHNQWIDEAIPAHLGSMVPCRMLAWNKKPIPDILFKKDKLAVFTINFDAVRTPDGKREIAKFMEFFGHTRVMIVVDESQEIKNDQAVRSIEIVALGDPCRYKMILTGTPIAKELTDEWSQFKFLDKSIIGHEYKTAFRAQYCVMHPKFKDKVIGSKNVEQFYELVEPHTYRITKEEGLDLPPKVYDQFLFELHPEQRKLYNKMRDELRVQLETGEMSSVKNAAVALMRLQQITCGYLALDKEDPDEATVFRELPWNPRLDALKQVRKSRLGKSVIWARFNKDIENILRVLGSGAVDYYGKTNDDQRIRNKAAFINDDRITDFVSNPAAGGTGVDGLQKVGRTAIYYSNSFNAIQRWQSEDRTHRIGMGGTCTYIDLVARNTVDSKILKNLQSKKDLSNLVLDDIRMMLEDQE